MGLALVSMSQMGFRINSRKINMRKPMTHSSEMFPVIKDKYFSPIWVPNKCAIFMFIHFFKYERLLMAPPPIWLSIPIHGKVIICCEIATNSQ